MKTYKQRFIEACKQIATEYESGKGHKLSAKTCSICKIYFDKKVTSPTVNNNKCSKCPIAYNNGFNNKTFSCANNYTYPKIGLFKVDEAFVSPIRAKFYRKVAKVAEFLPTKEFQPSMTKRKNSQLKSVIRTIDKVLNMQQKYRNNR